MKLNKKMNNKTILGRSTTNIDPNSADDWSNYFSMYNNQKSEGTMTYSEAASTYGTVGNWMNSGPVIVEMPDRHLSYEKSVMASAESKIVADMQRYNQLWTQRFNNEPDEESENETHSVVEDNNDEPVKNESLETELGQQILDEFEEQIDEQCENDCSDKTETVVENNEVVDVVDVVEDEDSVVFDDVIPSAGDDVEFVSEEPVFDVDVTVDIDDSVEDLNEDGFVGDSEIEIIEKVEEPEPVVCEASDAVAEVKPKAKKTPAKKKTTTKKTTTKKTTASKTSKK